MEYKFVRHELKLGFLSGKPKDNYKEIVHEHAREGWRLLQIFAPPIGGFGRAEYYEMIFERSVE